MTSSDSAAASLLRIPDFRWLLYSIGCTTLASRALAVVIGYQVYDLTKSPYSLGILGLVEAIPALSLALYGGHVADRHDRRSILQWTLGTLVFCALAFAALVLASQAGPSVVSLYAVVFVAGIARGFAEPAVSAIEAQVVPVELLMHASTWFASSWLACSILGPLLGGLAYGVYGPAVTYVVIAAVFADANVTLPSTGEKVEAVIANFEHADGTCLTVVVPYDRVGGAVKQRAPLSMSGDCAVSMLK